MSDRKKGDDARLRVDKAKEVFDKYDSEIRAIIEFTTQDKQSVEDIFQDFFLSLVNNPIPKEIEDVKSYIYKAILNDAIDRFRRARIHREGVKIYAELFVRDKAEQFEPQKKVIIAEEVEHMFSLMQDRLAPRHARVLMQHYRTDHNSSEDAEKAKIDKRSISKYLSDAIKQMRRVALKSRKEAIYLGMKAPAFE